MIVCTNVSPGAHTISGRDDFDWERDYKVAILNFYLCVL